MRWASILSEERESEAAALDASARLRSELDTDPDLVIAFASSHHASSYDTIASTLTRELGGANLIGCSGQSVIGGGHELESRPGLALTGATLPGVAIHPFGLDAAGLPPLDAAPAAWHERIGVDPEAGPHFLLLADPFGFDAEHFVSGMDQAYPASVKLGGVASGGQQPGQQALWIGAETRRSGLVGVGLSGNLVIDPVVAQGCRPVGTPLFVTHCHDNVLQRLDGQPPAELVEELFQASSAADRELFQNSLFLGLEMQSDQREYEQGDFLIRNIIGIDPDDGALAIAAPLRQSQVVQFHLRDAKASAQDLARCLDRYNAEVGGAKACGALLFSCLGRGVGLYGTPDHDSRAFYSKVGDVPLTGFFCNGEIGPVGGTTFLHGYTSSFALIGRRSMRPEPFKSDSGHPESGLDN